MSEKLTTDQRAAALRAAAEFSAKIVAESSSQPSKFSAVPPVAASTNASTGVKPNLAHIAAIANAAVAKKTSQDGLTLQQKRKLLWAKDDTLSTPSSTSSATSAKADTSSSKSGKNAWENAEFADSEQRSKFLRLMGAKKAVGGEKKEPPKETTSSSSFTPMSAKTQEKVFTELETEFDRALMRRGMGAAGLGTFE